VPECDSCLHVYGEQYLAMLITDSFAEALGRILHPGKLIVDTSAMEYYSMDASGRYSSGTSQILSHRVSGVVRPIYTWQVVEIVKLANEHSIPLIPYGGGTGLTGAASSVKGGLAVDLLKMDRIVDVSVEDRTVKVEAGTILANLDMELNREGLLLGHDPYSLPIATVGGAISTNGVGYRAAKYGSIGDQVLGLKVVMPNGEILRNRPVHKTSSGPSLYHLFVGAEGTLGIITEATLKVFKIPEARVFKSISFVNFEAGYGAMQEMFALGLCPALIDLSEEVAPTHPSKSISESLTKNITMYLVFEGYIEEVQSQVKRALDICRIAGGEDIGDQYTREYWNTRHDSAYQYKKRFIDTVTSSDSSPANIRGVSYPHVALPPSKVMEYREICDDICLKLGVGIREYCLWTHPGLFSMILVSVDLEALNGVSGLEEASNRVLTLAHEMGGSMEYVHGVGTKLSHLMEEEMGYGIEFLKRIKKTVDPNSIMNPGKMGL